MEKKIHDLIIIGTGPAGLSASIYASRYGISHLVVGEILGGQIAETHKLDNYPGIEDVAGFEFSQKLGNHAKKYGVEILSKRIKNITKEKEIIKLETESGEIFKAKTILLSTGTKKRELNIPGEKEFMGRGVSCCATCDGFFYKGKTVGIIGGSDSAVTAALYLADLCQKVYLIYRKSELRAEPIWVKQAKKNKKIEVIYDTNVIEIIGKEKLEEVKLDKKYNGLNKLKIDGLFIEAGSIPHIDYALDLGVETDDEGYVKIQKNGQTSVSGVFSAGDITDGSDNFRQVVTAVSEGAIAVRAIYKFLKK